MPGNKTTYTVSVLISIVLILCRIDVFAQYHSQPAIIGAISDRLPIGNQNWEICRNPVNGFMYFANSTGLIEYNGISTRLFSMPFGQGIRSVYADSSGIIYSGSFEDFGYWDSDNRGGLKYHSLTGNISIPKNDEIWNILELNGTLYFQSFTTIYAFKKGQVKALSTPGIMLFIFKCHNRLIVQLLGKGLFYFDGIQYRFIQGSEIFGSHEVLSIIERPMNHLWVCTSDNGIFNYDGISFIPLQNEISDYLKHQTCNTGLALNDSLMVFGTILNGIAFCNANGKITKSYSYNNGLSNNTVLCLYKDTSNDLWVGTDEGANYINPASPYQIFTDKNGSLGTIYSIIRKDNRLYLGTNHGLFVADITRVNGVYSFSELGLIPGTQGQVWKLYESGNQILCGHNDGTYLVTDRSVKKISNVTGGWSFTDYNGLLLQGTYTGIITFIPDGAGKWQFKSRIEGFGEPTRHIETDYLGFIWTIHPQQGIYRIELNEAADSVVRSSYYSNVGNADGKINISMINNQVVFLTSENVYSFDAENNRFFPVKSLEAGLGEYKAANHIIHYEKNSYWFMLRDKIALFNISKSFEAQKVLEVAQKYTDLPGREQQIILLDKHNLLIPTRQAFTLVDLSVIRRPASLAGPVITHMIFSGKHVSRFVIPVKNNTIVIPNAMNNLTAYIAYPTDFERSDKEIMYRIPQLDEVWRKMVADNFTFLNLKYGTYKLEVKSQSGDVITGVWFMVRRPWYMSIAAITGYGILLILSAFIAWRIFRNQLNRHRQIIEYELRKNKLENELDYKNYELMLTMRFLIRKTEILKKLQEQIDLLKDESSKYPVRFVKEMERIISGGLDSQTDEWKNVMNHLKLSQEGFFRKLKEKFPNLTPHDLRLCSYLRMNFTTKEIAHLLNISSRAVEIGRYRLRLKMNLDHSTNLTEYLIRESEQGL